MDLDLSLKGTREDLLSLFRAPWIAVDTESNGLDNRFHPDHKTMGISVWAPGWRTGKYFPFNHRYGNCEPELLPVFKALIEDPNRPTVYHNAKHDIKALEFFGIKVPDTYYCTMLMTHFLREELMSKSLDYVSKIYGGDPKNRGKVMQKVIDQFGWGAIPVEMMTPYASNDAKITGELFEKLLPSFRKEGFDGELWDIEKQFTALISEMEIFGINIDRELSEKEEFIGRIRLEEIQDLLGLNPASHKDMYELFINRLGLPVLKTSSKTGEPSFDKEVMTEYEMILEQRQDPTARLVFEWKGWHKTVTSNYRPYLSLSYNDILHPSYKLHGTKTSRLSCERPNLQQIPRESPKRWNGKLKRAFVARHSDTVLREYDYSNLEMRLGACYGNDANLLSTFNSGRNLFDDMSAQMGRERNQVKTANYAISYGCGAKKLGLIFGIPKEEAQALLNDYYRAYSGLRTFSKNAQSVARRRGYVKLWTGRRRHFENPEKDAHKAGNSLNQGGGAEIMKRKMLALAPKLDPNECRLVLTVHDSIVAEMDRGKVDKWDKIIKDEMSDVGSLHEGFRKCPFPVDGKQWGE